MRPSHKILWAVRSGADGAWLVSRATGLEIGRVYVLARILVSRGLLCALDPDPWCVTVEGALVTQRHGWRRGAPRPWAPRRRA